MIATGLIFLLGVLLATFVALLVSPLVWRKAQRLARRDFEATIPSTVNEIRAGFDHVRAEAALAARRQEMQANDIRDKAALERAEAGRIAAQNADLRVRARTLEDRITQQDEELADIRSVLVAREDDNARLTASLRETQRDLDLRIEEMDALALRFRDLTEIAEERKVHIVSIETKLERVSDNLRSSERRGRELQESIDRLRGDVATLEGSVKREKSHSASLDDKLTRLTARLADREEELSRLRLAADPQAEPREGTAAGMNEKALVEPGERPAAEIDRPRPSARSQWSAPAQKPGVSAAREGDSSVSTPLPAAAASLTEAGDDEMRERINEIAARVIRMMAIAEGPESPIEKLIGQPSGNGEPRPDARPTLADRVRLLMDADREAGLPDRRRESQAADDAAE